MKLEKRNEGWEEGGGGEREITPGRDVRYEIISRCFTATGQIARCPGFYSATDENLDGLVRSGKTRLFSVATRRDTCIWLAYSGVAEHPAFSSAEGEIREFCPDVSCVHAAIPWEISSSSTFEIFFRRSDGSSIRKCEIRYDVESRETRRYS